MQPKNMEQLTFNPGFIITVVIIILVIVAGTRSFAVIEPGHAGLVKRFGEIIGEPKSAGLVWRVPFVDDVVIIDIRTQKLQINAKAESKDLQSIDSEIVLNYHPFFKDVGTIYKKIGRDYESKVIIPALNEEFKAEAAKYNAEELITRRQEVRKGVTDNIREKLVALGIELEALSIVAFSFSESYSRAIDMKQVAEQDALRADHELKKVTTEQRQHVEKARAEKDANILRAQGEAEAISIRAEAEAKALEILSKAAKPSALQARTIEKWDGVLPRVTGGAIPMLNVEKASGVAPAK